VRHEWRLDLGVPVLFGVQVEHEIDQRSRESGAGTDKCRKARGGDLRSSLEVDDAKRGAEIPVRLRGESKRPWFAAASYFDIARCARPYGYARVRHVRNRQEVTLPLLLNRVELRTRLLDALCPLAADLL